MQTKIPKMNGTPKITIPLVILICIASSACLCLPVRASSVTIDGLGQLNQQVESKINTNQAASDVIAIKEGADLDLSCPIVVKNEDMIISWTCDDEPANIRSSRIHVTDSGKLRIHSSKVGDSCNYRCEAADGHGALSVVIKVIIVDQRLMEQLTRRAHASSNMSSLQTVNETKSEQPARKRLIGGSSSGRPRDSARVQHHQGQTSQLVPSSVVRTQQDPAPEIEMQIEPSEISVAKNKTVNLECRIKHSSHLMTPQIIWLKEYMGNQIESLKDAIDKNLIYLDGFYYHSLNWPRAITYSEKSSSFSSALLIRQASYVHSGRYVCFAGYPSSVMNLHHNNSLATSANTLSEPTVSTLAHRSPLKYKLAQAIVRVDDKEGEEAHRSSLEWVAKGVNEGGQEDPRDPASVFLSVVSANTWQRNTTIVLLIFCSSMMLVKFILLKNRAQKSQPQHVPMINDPDDVATSDEPPLVLMRTNGALLNSVRSGNDPPSSLAGPMVLLDAFRDRFADAPANSLIGGNNALRDEYRIDQDLLNERLNGIDTSNNGDSNNDHVYSEISCDVQMPGNDEPYYKRPNKNI